MADASLEVRLADGPTNTTWRVRHAGRNWVLRLDKPAAAELGLDRAGERDVCAVVAAAGLGPGYRHFDSAAGVCLRPFLDGAVLAPDDLRDRGTLAELADTLRRLHALPPVGRSFDPLSAALRYARAIGTADAADLARHAADLLNSASAPTSASVSGPAPTLCHNDLVAANIVCTPRGLQLIDWEYAGLGDPYFDLAVVIRHHGLGEELATHLLTAYLQREPGEAEIAHLRSQCDFYGVLLDLWKLRIAL